jgi:hypothetical protein
LIRNSHKQIRLLYNVKVKLFVLAALVLLSSINSIFNSIPIIGVSAQEYEEIDGDNSYEPASYGDRGQEGYSSYDNYEYLYSEYLEDDYSSETPSSYEQDNSDYSYGDSYDKNYYPPKEPKKFTCQGSGLVVDKEENCPLVCPAGTDLSGHLVAAGSDLPVVCDEDAQFETCGTGTDLEGVLVANEPEDCNIFAICDDADPLGVSLGLTTGETVEVADEQLCELAVPSDVVLEQCEPTDNIPNALVTDLRLCNVATEANICTTGDLAGVYVDDPTTQCNISITTNTESQCLKCADLAVFQALNTAPQTTSPFVTFPQREASTDLTASATDNVFTICQAATDAEQIEDFNTLVDITNNAQETLIETGFSTCITNAPTPPTPPTTSLQPQSLESSLQENSLTTNVKPEAEISTFSAPTIAQGTEDSTTSTIPQGTEDSAPTSAKIEKLKQQWLDLVP